jgi:hypothetical protein
MGAVVTVILIAAAFVLGMIVGQPIGARAFEAHARRQVAKLLRDPDDMEAQAEFLKSEAKLQREKRGG